MRCRSFASDLSIALVLNWNRGVSQSLVDRAHAASRAIASALGTRKCPVILLYIYSACIVFFSPHSALPLLYLVLPSFHPRSKAGLLSDVPPRYGRGTRRRLELIHVLFHCFVKTRAHNMCIVYADIGRAQGKTRVAKIETHTA